MQDRGTGNSQDVGNGYEGGEMKEFLELEDIIWFIKSGRLMVKEKEVEKIITISRDAISNCNNKDELIIKVK